MRRTVFRSIAAAMAMLAVVFSFSVPRAFAQSAFSSVPTEANEKPSGLELRFVQYRGGTNGEIEVEVRNPKGEDTAFVAKGIYFVPDGDPEKAPQRLGAVGPLRVMENGQWTAKERAIVPKGKVERFRLDVYCVDSHRSSPTSETKFHVAATRIPKPLADTIHREASAAAVTSGGIAAPAAKSAVQSKVWQSRDEKWIPLQGEGSQERGKATRNADAPQAPRLIPPQRMR